MQQIVTVAAVGLFGFFASDFVQTRDENTGEIERRVSNDITEIKALIREQGATTRREIERINARVSDLELSKATDRGALSEIDRRLDLISKLIRERTIDQMELEK